MMLAARDAEERELAGVDPGFESIALGLGQASGLDGFVDAVRERLLQGRAELARLHAQLLRRVVEDRLRLVIRRAELRGGDCAARSGGREPDSSDGDEFSLDLHSFSFRLFESAKQRGLKRR